MRLLIGAVAALLAVVGLALIGVTVANGGGALAIGVVLGVVSIGVAVLLGKVAVRLSPERRKRPCPRCGLPVRAGVLDCAGCGFDFRTVGAG